MSKSKEVYQFYQGLHFNESNDLGADLSRIQSNDLLKFQFLPSFTDALEEINSSGNGNVIEAGCGIGWLSIATARKYPKLDVTGLDFSDRALRSAKSLNVLADNVATFSKANLMNEQTLPCSFMADALFSIGVLHHTANFLSAVENVAALVKPNGHLFLGLYHAYRRAPFLSFFNNLRQKGASEAELLAEYKKLDRRPCDETRKRSWFFDQVMHPHETQHTVGEVVGFLSQKFDHVSNSITHAALPPEKELAEIERRQEIIGNVNLQKGFYDPGFFLVHLKRHKTSE